MLTPHRAPNWNAFAERFVRTMKEEWMTFSGRAALRGAITQLVEHDHRERPHQGLGYELLETGGSRPNAGSGVQVHQRFGGTLEHYREAA